MSMREKIARAIADQIGYDYDKVFEHKQEWVAEGGLRDGRFHDVNEPYRSDFDCAANAVLDALMEPTEGMQEIGDHAYNLTGISGASGFPATSEEHTTFIFEAMIQAARDGK